MQLLLKTVWRFLRELNIELPYDTTILLLGIYTKEMKTYQQKALKANIHSRTIHKSQKMEAIQMPNTW